MKSCDHFSNVHGRTLIHGPFGGIAAKEQVMLKEIETSYQDYKSPPPVDDARENETSWTYFRKKVPPPPKGR